MVLKILHKIAHMWHKFNSNYKFRLVNCNLDKIVIGSDVNRGFEIRYPSKLSIGDGTVINGMCMINAMGGVTIGKYCHIAKGLTLYSHNHNYKSTTCIPYDGNDLLRPVSVGDAVWIGANVTVAPGSKIGHGVIISNGAVVFGSIPDCAIVRGNPAEIIGYRDVAVFWKLYKDGRLE